LASVDADLPIRTLSVDSGVPSVTHSRARRRRRGTGRCRSDAQQLDRVKATDGRWVVYLLAGALAASALGPWLVRMLLACGIIELTVAGVPSLVSHRTHSPGSSDMNGSDVLGTDNSAGT
jgi:hypothetical protein